MELLHILGEVPEGLWAVFSTPEDAGRGMASVVVPKSLWRWMTAHDPFTSEVTWVDRVGRAALARHLARGTIPALVWVEAQDLGGPWETAWGAVLRTCGQCGQPVPAGEVLEGMKNAMPPDEGGTVTVSVFCPACSARTAHRLSPYGVAREP
ncbi:MAG: hypothetical protein K6U14_05825 [Firmicutes bacterium]|nr:hypothetical protein [Alicyclobacillaceae bacterium]MCL6497138.1 hypothetical protein [Bacillota bacterium]